MIAVTFALPVESSDFVRLLDKREPHSHGGVKSIRGHLHHQPVSILHTGVGEKTCRRRIESFLGQQRPKYLISAGFAGALDNQLRVGALLIAENFSSPALLGSPQLDSISDTFLLGRLVTASGIIDSQSERNQLATQTGALAVDMETEFIAAACSAHGIPMLSLRVMSDTPSEPLPAPPNVLFDVVRQKTNFGRLAIYLAMHPDRVKPLLAFRKRVMLARRSLTSALNQLLRVDLIGPM